MDRLPVVIAALLAAAGCDKGGGAEATEREAPRSRVNAVQKSAEQAADPAELCDVMPAAKDAPRLALPPLAEGSGPLPATSGWRWVNFWATWCQPCVEELPLLSSWKSRLGGKGAPLELTLISADESDEVVAEFRKRHPATPESLRLADSDQMVSWLEGLGVPGATLPVHVIVDPEDRVRCIRASAISENDFAAARALLRGK